MFYSSACVHCMCGKICEPACACVYGSLFLLVCARVCAMCTCVQCMEARGQCQASPSSTLHSLAEPGACHFCPSLGPTGFHPFSAGLPGSHYPLQLSYRRLNSVPVLELCPLSHPAQPARRFFSLSFTVKIVPTPITLAPPYF